MATRTWTGAVSGDISVAANWGGTEPGAGEPMVIPSTGITNWPSTGTLPSTATGAILLNSGGLSVGQILGGVWPATAGPLTVAAAGGGGQISGGTFACALVNGGQISGGTFNGAVTNSSSGTISDGTFNGAVSNTSGGAITGGTFNGSLTIPDTFGAATIQGTVQTSDAIPVVLFGRAGPINITTSDTIAVLSPPRPPFH